MSIAQNPGSVEVSPVLKIMEKQTSPKTEAPTNLLIELAKRKAEAQKAGHNFGHFAKGKGRPQEKALIFPRGGRNGQGKP